MTWKKKRPAAVIVSMLPVIDFGELEGVVWAGDRVLGVAEPEVHPVKRRMFG